VSGAQLTDRARRQATKFGAEVLTTREVTGLEVRGSARRVTFADGAFIDAHTVLLATGVSYRKLNEPGLAELTGRGVYYGSALTEASACLGRTCTSSAARTRPGRPPCTCRATPGR
jgi:thioredoxin reductase (NADPH)